VIVYTQTSMVLLAEEMSLVRRSRQSGTEERFDPWRGSLLWSHEGLHRCLQPLNRALGPVFRSRLLGLSEYKMAQECR